MSEDKTDISKMSFEQARDELQKVVAELEQQNVSLEDSMKLWERGEQLAKHCESWLGGARKKLDDALEEAGE
jgi:exodeoxyribonuclease VII small subunit